MQKVNIEMKKILLLITVLFLTQNTLAAPLRLTFKCDRPPIEFTLGENSNPSKPELLKLCNCVNEKISDKSKLININIQSKKDVSSDEIKLFNNEFGKAMASCGAMSM
jgi:hypothetical protein